MKTRNLFYLCLAFLLLGTIPTQAQSLGSILKKAKKVLSTIDQQTKSTSTTTSTAASAKSDDGPKAKATPIAGGGTLYNPFEKNLDVEVVEVYGTSKSMNFGNVSVVLKLKAKTVIDKINYIGDDKTTAYDDEGNVYRIDNTAYSIKVAEGISVKADLGAYNLHFLNVPKKTQKLQLVKLFLYNDFEDGSGAQRGYIELRDVPITWRK
jgi:Sec-independent protein translocase protein TatA